MSTVKLYVYDLSKGMAAAFSQAFIGTHIDGVWHTSVVFNGIEFYFGQGIFRAVPGATHLGPPHRVIEMGTTEVPVELFNEFLTEISPDWTAQSYNILTHNCNHFSDQVCQFLVGKSIPQYILDVAETVGATQFGQMLTAMPPPV